VEKSEPLTVRDISAELDCSEDEVRALIRAGELRTVACGIRPGLVPRHVLDDYLRRHRTAHSSGSASNSSHSRQTHSAS
jgi:excisionase family DNA binding protein